MKTLASSHKGREWHTVERLTRLMAQWCATRGCHVSSAVRIVMEVTGEDVVNACGECGIAAGDTVQA